MMRRFHVAHFDVSECKDSKRELQQVKGTLNTGNFTQFSETVFLIKLLGGNVLRRAAKTEGAAAHASVS